MTSELSPTNDLVEAVRRIRAAVKNDLRDLDLGELSIERLPEEILNLPHLKTLCLSNCCRLTSIAELKNLTNLTTLDLSRCMDLTSLAGLENLTQLTTLDLSHSGLTSLAGLENLTQLTTLNLWFSMKLQSTAGLENLTNLTRLNLSWCCSLAEVDALNSLTELTSLDLSGPNMRQTDMATLGNLTKLITLDLSGCNCLTSLAVLGNMTELTTLVMQICPSVTSVEELKSLLHLTTLNLSWCVNLTSVESLRALPVLTDLRLEGCRSVQKFSPLQPLLPRLSYLNVRETRFHDLHPSVCVGDDRGNALNAVQRYFVALGPNAMPDPEIKVYVIGNGEAGKTKLVGRLRGELFDAIPEISTHGIELSGYDLPECDDLPHRIRLIFWDFGGQDIYHGTHALFLRGPAIYLLLYSHKTEDDREFVNHGALVKNRRLMYWFDYLRQVTGEDNEVPYPLLLVQSRCDAVADRYKAPPYWPDEGFPHLFSHCLPVSSKRGYGLEELRDELRNAVIKLLQHCPQPPLPTRWADVRNSIRKLQLNHSCRILTMADFANLCKKNGCDGDQEVLRDALHEMGVVFYRKGAFANDPIILDQSWALDALYAVFTRDAAYQQFIQNNGRFTRKNLDDYIWSRRTPQIPPADQRTILNFMEQCHVCFRVSGERDDDDSEYIALDLLGPWEDHAPRYWWQAEIPPTAFLRLDFTALHDGILRSLLAQIGHLAGDRPTYWRFGCRFLDRRTNSDVTVRTEGNALCIRAWGGEAESSVQSVLDLVNRMPLGRRPDPLWVFGRCPRSASAQSTESPPLEPIRPPTITLGQLGNDAARWRKRLVTFYWIGRMFNEGATSLAEVEAKLAELQKKLPERGKFGTKIGGLSTTIKLLREGLFTLLFGGREAALLQVTGSKGACTMTDEGKQAWRATCEYLWPNGNVPDS